MIANNLKKRNYLQIFCFAIAFLGFFLLALGAFLITQEFDLAYISIATLVAGVLLLICGCIPKCLRYHLLICILLILVTLFLIITGILSILSLTIFSIIIGLILIGFGTLSLILSTICCCLTLVNHKPHLIATNE